MDDCSCDICFKEFNETEVIPKVLECGHSICSICLSTILKTMKKCPKCQTALSKPDIDNFPTNFAFLAVSKILLESRPNKTYAPKSFEPLKMSYLRCKERLLKNIGTRNTLKGMIAGNLLKIQQVLDSDEDMLELKELDQMIIDLTEDLEKVENILNCCKPSILNAILSPSKYKDSSHFLYAVSTLLHKNEELFVATKIDGQHKYGQISSEGDFIIIHSFSSTKINKKASVIWLDELRKATKMENVLPFVEFLGSGSAKPTKLFLKMTDSCSALQFIKLCTGETGPTYKNSVFSGLIAAQQQQYDSYDQDDSYGQYVGNLPTYAPKLSEYMLNDVKTKGAIDYDLSGLCQHDTSIPIGATYITGASNGEFEILGNTTGAVAQCRNVVGIGFENKSSNNYTVGQQAVISDSGIALKLN